MPAGDNDDRFPRFAPVEPDRAAATFRVQAGFRMELVAAEPLVTDPVAMTIDENGRAFVVEMNDYPYTDPERHRPWQENPTDAPLGRVRMLVDSDRDGVYDRSTVFATDLSWPSGILCHRGGVIVTATPDIWYLADTDGDGRADRRERLFTGFRKYNVQAVMNNPIRGLDNAIYVAGASNGGSVVRPGESAVKPIAARGDFRIDPDLVGFQLQAGGARFGNSCDDFGNRFLCHIRNPAIHVVVDARYTARNPFFAAPSLTIDAAAAGDQLPIHRISPVEPWRELRGRRWSADPTKKLPRSELTGGGVFTSASGIVVYRGAAYPASFAGQLFLGEVANNVIYRQAVAPRGNTFAAERADSGVEFVASDDTWFRPVNLYNAPDGTLYVLDMYREFIEHPWSIPDDIHARLDLTSGRDRGRIYRLAPPDFRFTPDDVPSLSERSSRHLVETLRHRGSWWRETAQRLLVERGDRGASAAIRGLLHGDDPVAAVHALWTLQGLGSLETSDLLSALTRPHPRVREHAIRAAEPRLGNDDELLARTLALVDDPDRRVRLQLLFSLGAVDQPEARAAIARLALRDGNDPWTRVAIGCLPPGHCEALLATLIADAPFLASAAAPAVLESLADIAGARDAADVTGAAATFDRIWEATCRVGHDRSAPPEGGGPDAPPVGSEASIDALWNGLASGARRKGRSLYDLRRAARLTDEASLAGFLAREFLIADDERCHDARRIAATTRLAMAGCGEAAAWFDQLLDAHHPQGVQLAAIRGLAGFHESPVLEALLPRLPTVSPAVREELLTVLLSRPEWSLAVLRSVERKETPAALLGLGNRTALLASTDPEIGRVARAVLGQADESRQAIFERYCGPVRAKTPDADVRRGAEIFARQCAVCHRLGGVGHPLGPHLETVRDWDVDRVLLNILDPNREVAPQSMSHVIALSDGRSLAGLIADETSSSLTLKRAGVADEVILRADVESLANTGRSFMPVGFEEVISPDDMADLIAYIKRPAP